MSTFRGLTVYYRSVGKSGHRACSGNKRTKVRIFPPRPVLIIGDYKMNKIDDIANDIIAGSELPNLIELVPENFVLLGEIKMAIMKAVKIGLNMEIELQKEFILSGNKT